MHQEKAISIHMEKTPALFSHISWCVEGLCRSKRGSVFYARLRLRIFSV
jgi:hypothetical protein